MQTSLDTQSHKKKKKKKKLISHRFLSKQLERTSSVKDDTKFTDPLLLFYSKKYLLILCKQKLPLHWGLRFYTFQRL